MQKEVGIIEDKLQRRCDEYEVLLCIALKDGRRLPPALQNERWGRIDVDVGGFYLGL